MPPPSPKENRKQYRINYFFRIPTRLP
ncbi:hypothetical protein YPPY19_1004, partial [Yersinia pestis PY-19]